jgi:tripartite-type tricarboxylate transporter receptor subunit TctC
MAPGIAPIADVMPGFEVTGYFGLIGPKGMPGEVVARLNRECVAIMQLPEIDARMRQLGLEPLTGTADEFASLMAKDYRQWVKLLKETGLKVE